MAIGLAPPQDMVGIAASVSSSAFPLLAPDGSVTAPSYAFSSSTATGMFRTSTGTGQYVFEEANISAIRNGTSAQILRVYNTFTDASNGEWFEANWQASANSMILRANANGTGTNRSLILCIAGSTVAAFQVQPTALSTATSRIRMFAGNNITATSGTESTYDVNVGSTTASASTLVHNVFTVQSTINFSNGTRTGANRLMYFTSVNTSLQTGNNAAIALSSTASALGGLHIYNTSNETTNTERLTITATANKFKIMSVIQGTGTQRDIVLGGSYGGGMVVKVASTTLASVSGATVTATNLVPARAQVIGVATYVTVALGTGSGTTGYTVGDGSDADRFGAVTGTSIGTDTDSSTDATADPRMTWSTSAANIVITAAGGNFDGTGTIRVEVYYIGDTAPTS